MIGITYKLDRDQLRRAERGLKKLETGMPKILSRVVNKTATSTRVSMVKKMKGAYTEKPTDLKQNMEIRRASYDDPTAVIRLSGKAQPSIHFRHSKGGRGGVKLQVRRDSSFKAVVSEIGEGKTKETRKAFIAKMPSGHEGIFQRRAGEYMKKSPRMSRANIALKSQHTERIKELMSPSPVKMVKTIYGGDENPVGGMEPEVRSLFQKYFEQQMDLVLGGRKKREVSK